MCIVFSDCMSQTLNGMPLLSTWSWLLALSPSGPQTVVETTQKWFQPYLSFSAIPALEVGVPAFQNPPKQQRDPGGNFGGASAGWHDISVSMVMQCIGVPNVVRLSWPTSPQIMTWRLIIYYENLTFSLACSLLALTT